MEYKIVKASNVAKKAMRQANKNRSNCPQVWEQKKYAMRQYKKMLHAKKNKKKSMDQDYSKYLEWAILATIGLAVLSVSYPQVGILAIIFSILIVAAIMDTKIKNNIDTNKKETEEKMQRFIRMIQNERKNSAIEVQASGPSIEVTQKKLPKVSPQKEAVDDENTRLHLMDFTGTVTEFPYKNVQ